MTHLSISCPEFATGLQALGYWQTNASKLYAGLKDYFSTLLLQSSVLPTKKNCQVFVYARDSLLLNRSHRELIFVLQDQVK